jgi:dihydroxyacetone kinase
MGGSSGVLMSIFFTAAGQKLEQGASVAEALNAGLAQMKFYGGADEGDRTMIDALQPALAALLAEPENLQAAFPRRRRARIAPASQQSRRRTRPISTAIACSAIWTPAPTRWRWCLRRWRNEPFSLPLRWRYAHARGYKPQHRREILAPPGRRKAPAGRSPACAVARIRRDASGIRRIL